MRVPRRVGRGGAGAVLAAGLALGCSREVVVTEPPPPRVTVARPLTRSVRDYDYFNGWLQAADTVEVRARVSGYLTKIAFEPGETVAAGDLLFEIDPRPFRAEVDRVVAEVAQAEAELARATASLARAERLAPSRTITQEEYDRTVAEKAVAEATVKARQAALEQARLSLEFTRVTAPLAGIISRNLISEGNLVTADSTALTTIVSVSPMHVYFYVDERALQNYQRQNRLRDPDADRKALAERQIPCEFGLETDDGYPHPGMLDFSDNQIDASTGTVLVRGIADNSRRLLVSGERVRIRVPGREDYQALLVPETALLSDQDKKYLLVLNTENVVLRRDVRLGRLLEDGLRVILPADEPLGPQDRVVTLGLQAARVNYPAEPVDGEGRPVSAAPAAVPANPPGGAPAEDSSPTTARPPGSS